MYMRHTQRGLLLLLAMLPCGLMSAGCLSLAKLVVVVTCVAYLMLGIDEIGIQIEQPFEVLPLAISRLLPPSPAFSRRLSPSLALCQVLPLHVLAAILTRDVADRMLNEDGRPHGNALDDGGSEPSSS